MKRNLKDRIDALKRFFQSWKGLMICILICCGLNGCTSNGDKKPNLLFIMTDQQPFNCVGVYGNDKIHTPNLDQLGAEGVVLENFYIAAFPCSPSRASILSGRYLHNHNVFTNNVWMDTSIQSLGHLFAAADYHTGYFGKAHLGGSMYVGRQDGDGIDYMHDTTPADPVGEDITQYWHYERIEGDSGWLLQRKDGGVGEDFPQLGFRVWAGGWRQYKDWLISHGQDSFALTAGNHDALQSAPEGEHMYSRLGEDYHMAHFFTEETKTFILEHQKSERPWAAVLSYFGPHLPVSPPQPWDTLHSLEDVDLPHNLIDSLEGKPIAQKKTELQYVLGQWSEDQYKDYIRRYWGYCAYIDNRIGQVFRLLKETGQWDNTIIIFTSDHGDMVAGHGMIFKLGSNAYEELFRVPAIISLPGGEFQGLRIKELASSVDLLPTILDAAGIAVPAEIDGKSLLPFLKDQVAQHRPAVFAEIHTSNHGGKVIMCRSQRYKYVYHWLSSDVDELYDLEADPGELNNLIGDESYREVVDNMKDFIVEWSRETGHRYASLIGTKQ